MFRFTRGAVAALAIAAAAEPAFAQAPIVENGSFESGLTGWVRTTVARDCILRAATTSSMFHQPAPTSVPDGVRFADVSTISVSSTCGLYQDIALPADSDITQNLSAASLASGNANSVARICITDTTGPRC